MKTLRERVVASLGEHQSEEWADTFIEDALMPWLKDYRAERDTTYDRLYEQMEPRFGELARDAQRSERVVLDRLFDAIAGEH